MYECTREHLRRAQYDTCTIQFTNLYDIEAMHTCTCTCTMHVQYSIKHVHYCRLKYEHVPLYFKLYFNYRVYWTSSLNSNSCLSRSKEIIVLSTNFGGKLKIYIKIY